MSDAQLSVYFLFLACFKCVFTLTVSYGTAFLDAAAS